MTPEGAKARRRRAIKVEVNHDGRVRIPSCSVDTILWLGLELSACPRKSWRVSGVGRTKPLAVRGEMRARAPVRNATGLETIMEDNQVSIDMNIEAKIRRRSREYKRRLQPRESAETSGDYQLMRSYLIGSPDPELYNPAQKKPVKAHM
jgi:hypothetical protein